MKYLIIGHGNFASGVKTNIEMVLGKCERCEYINFSNEMTSEQLQAEIEIKVDEDSIIFTDIIGGIPFELACRSADRYEKVQVIGGFNISGLVDAILANQGDIEKIKKNCLKSVKIYQK